MKNHKSAILLKEPYACSNSFSKIIKAITYLFAVSAIILVSCSQEETGYSISGSFQNGSGEKLTLYEMSSHDLIPADSAFLDSDGKFAFAGEIDQITFMTLRADQLNYIVLIVSPGEVIELTADYNDLQSTASVKGSPESKLSIELNRKMHSTIMKMDSLGEIYRAGLNTPGTDIDSLRNIIRSEYEAITEDQRQYTINFITQYTSSLASLMALYQQTDPSTFVLSGEDDFRYYSLVDSVLIEKHPNLQYTATLNENVREMREQFNIRRERESLLAGGSVAPEISLPTPQGDTVSLSSLRGNYVLLDFWAAWCGPCRHENPYLVRTYDKYSDQGFNIYQVSLDRTRDAWLNGIEEDGIGKWTHVSDLQFWGSVVVPLYNIEGIPANFLLDPEGRIIARNLRGEELERTVGGLYN